jgi:putative transposase
MAQARLEGAAGAEARATFLQAGFAGMLQSALALLEAEVEEKAGPRYERWAERQGYRNGHVDGWIVVGGRKVCIRRPRLRDAEGREVELETYGFFHDEAQLDEAMLIKVIQKVACSQVHRGLEEDQPLPKGPIAYGDSPSSVSRRWRQAVEDHVKGFLERRLDDRRYLAVILDGKGFGDHLLITALGIDEQGAKRVLGVWPGSTENADVCAALLDELEQRGLDVRQGVLVITDGGKGIIAAVRRKWGDVAILGRCAAHKKRNVLKYVPQGERRWVERALWRAWHEPDAEQAERDLEALVAELQERWPEAAASLREGLAETLTCQKLGLPPELLRALRTTNLIESVFSGVEAFTHRVCRWRNQAQALRWARLALFEAERGFRSPVAGPAAMARLQRILAAEMARRAGPQELLRAG